MFFVHSKKDLFKNEEERVKIMTQIYPDSNAKKESNSIRHGISNSQIINHESKSNHQIYGFEKLDAKSNLQTTDHKKSGNEISKQKWMDNFGKYEITSNFLKYKKIPAGAFSVGKHKQDFVDKYPFCEYLSLEEIYKEYNANDYVTLEKQNKIFRYTDEGEFLLIDKAILDSQRGVITDVIKQATMNIIKGKGLMRVQMPIRLFEPICSYELVARFTGCMDKIHEAAKEAPGIERLKLIMAWIVGGFIHTMAVKKPFNNIMGETMNAEYSDGTKIYAEHVQHDPPVEMVLLVNEDLKFRMHANFETTVALGPNEVTILCKGIITIEFGGDKIYIQIAPLANRGLLFGQLRVCASEAFYFYYPSCQLKGLIKIGEKKCQDLLTGGIYWTDTEVPINTNTFRRDLFSCLKAKTLIKEKCVSVVSGRLFTSLNFDEKEYWNKDHRFYGLHLSKHVLPSDWLFRDDIMWLKRGNPELSMKWKIQLEDVNRDWRKMREAYKKKNKLLFK